MDIIPSSEQLLIINSKNNTIVDAVAGSGKTTTAILIASSNKNQNIFQITYNSMLKIEVREKLIKYNAYMKGYYLHYKLNSQRIFHGKYSLY